MPLTVVITGASSGIGAALARRYARDGAALGLIGRDPSRLAAVAEACLAEGAAAAEVGRLDVRDRDDLIGWIEAFDARRPIDLLIANAGVTGGQAPDGRLETAGDSLALIETNVLGAAAAVQAALPGMTRRRSGQVCVVSSIAALVPLPGVPSYCASKAFGLSYALALRETLRPLGIRVSAALPGYVDTPLLDRLAAARPTLISPDTAADKIHDGLARDRRTIAFPWSRVLLTRILAALPGPLARRLAPPIRVRPQGAG